MLKNVKVLQKISQPTRQKNMSICCEEIYKEYMTLISEALNKVYSKIVYELNKEEKTRRVNNAELGKAETFQKYEKVFERNWKIAEGRLRAQLPKIRDLWAAYRACFKCYYDFGGRDKQLTQINNGLEKAVNLTDNGIIDILLDKKRLRGEVPDTDSRVFFFVLDGDHLNPMYL